MATADVSTTIRNLQLLRAVAAYMVVAHHVFEYPKRYIADWPVSHVGAAGVDLFFVISGIVMALTTLRADLDPARFLARRAWRIVPLYWLFTTVVLVMLLAGMHPLGLHSWTAWDVVASYLFQPSSSGPILVVGWTLNFEMFFYLIVAASTFVRRVSLRTAIVIGSLVALAAIGAIWNVPQGSGASNYAELFLNSLLLEFAAGFVLGRLYALQRDRIPSGMAISLFGVLAVALALAGFVYAATIEAMPTLWRVAIFGLPSIAMCAGALLLEKAGIAVRSRFLLFLGDASFVVYLTHPLIAQTFEKVAGTFLPQTLGVVLSVMAATFVVVTLVSAAVHIWVERPLSAVGKSLLASRKKPLVEVPAEAPRAERSVSAASPAW